MEVWILDESFRSLFLIDAFESLLWVERFVGYGDFEIYTPVELNMLKQIKKNYYAWIKDSEAVMIIETIQITTSTEEGPRLIFSGRSLECILDHYIIWDQTVLSGDLQSGVEKLLNENIIRPDVADRKLSNFVFERSDDPAITGLKHNAQYTGDNLYKVICSICEAYNIGFKITLNEKYQFVFKFYAGKDRSFDQNENPYIIFSSKFENVISSNYIDSDKNLRNVALVAGEGTGRDRKRSVVVTGPDITGMNRRELYVDARDIQSETSEDEIISDTTYDMLLKTRGVEKLADYKSTQTFEGEMETVKTFVYGRDFFKGDIVQFVNEYDMETKVQVVEFVRAQDVGGYSTYPTFSIIE